MKIDAIATITMHEKCITLTIDDITVFDPPMASLPPAEEWGEIKTNVKGRLYRTTKRRFRWDLAHVSNSGSGTLTGYTECPPCDAGALFTQQTSTATPTAQTVAI